MNGAILGLGRRHVEKVRDVKIEFEEGKEATAATQVTAHQALQAAHTHLPNHQARLGENVSKRTEQKSCASQSDQKVAARR